MQILIIIVVAILVSISIGVAVYFGTQSSTTAAGTGTTAGTTGTPAAGNSGSTAGTGSTTSSTPGLPSLTLSNLNTAWNDEGGGSSIYLDRHDVSCPAQSGMSSFALKRKGDGNYREEYGCLVGSDFGAQTASFTPANDWGQGNTVFLDRHNVQCPAGNVLNDWHVTRPSQDTIRIDYKCVPAPGLGNCENLTTPWNDEGGGNSVYLDRHAVQCPNNKMLTQWHLVRKGDGNYHIEYSCCGR